MDMVTLALSFPASYVVGVVALCVAAVLISLIFSDMNEPLRVAAVTIIITFGAICALALILIAVEEADCSPAVMAHSGYTKCVK